MRAAPEDASPEQRVFAPMQMVYDPEIAVNIYDLGFIYSMRINEQA